MNESQICTNIKQSLRLIAAGVDPNSADMHIIFESNYEWYVERGMTGDVEGSKGLAWSLHSLIMMLPKLFMIRDNKVYVNGMSWEENDLFENVVNCIIYFKENE